MINLLDFSKIFRFARNYRDLKIITIELEFLAKFCPCHSVISLLQSEKNKKHFSVQVSSPLRPPPILWYINLSDILNCSQFTQFRSFVVVSKQTSMAFPCVWCLC